jgi:hypothetical protein
MLAIGLMTWKTTMVKSATTFSTQFNQLPPPTLGWGHLVITRKTKTLSANTKRDCRSTNKRRTIGVCASAMTPVTLAVNSQATACSLLLRLLTSCTYFLFRSGSTSMLWYSFNDGLVHCEFYMCMLLLMLLFQISQRMSRCLLRV